MSQANGALIQPKTFSSVAAFAGPLDVDFSGNGPASIARGEYVSGDYFSTLGVKTVVGRPLGPAALINAITDALGHENIAMPATPQAVWRAARSSPQKIAAE